MWDFVVSLQLHALWPIVVAHRLFGNPASRPAPLQRGWGGGGAWTKIEPVWVPIPNLPKGFGLFFAV